MKPKQFELLKKEPKSYGGDLRKTRKERMGPRPLGKFIRKRSNQKVR